jgi:predicted esterase
MASTIGDFSVTMSSDPKQNLASTLPTFRCVFPDAGQRWWCTAFGEPLSAWFDAYSLDDLDERGDFRVAGLQECVPFLKSVIEEEVDRLGGTSEKLVPGGFSQGSATAVAWHG